MKKPTRKQKRLGSIADHVREACDTLTAIENRLDQLEEVLLKHRTDLEEKVEEVGKELDDARFRIQEDIADVEGIVTRIVLGEVAAALDVVRPGLSSEQALHMIRRRHEADADEKGLKGETRDVYLRQRDAEHRRETGVDEMVSKPLPAGGLVEEIVRQVIVGVRAELARAKATEVYSAGPTAEVPAKSAPTRHLSEP